MASLSELLAQIYADVRDLGARTVYGDALIEAGDPRGELIALQLERGRTGERASPRETELLRDHRDAWLGELAPVLSEARFENGFLYQAQVRRYPLTAALVDRHEWSTIEHLDATYALREEPTAWALGELIARLAQLATLDVHLEHLDAIRGRVGGHALERLAVMLSARDATPLDDLLEARTFDRLDRLRIRCDAQGLGDAVIAAGVRAGNSVELEVLPGPEPQQIARVIDGVVEHVRGVTVYPPWGGRIRATFAGGDIVVHLYEPAHTTPGDIVPVPLYRLLSLLGASRVVVRLPPGIPPAAAPSLAGFRVEPT